MPPTHPDGVTCCPSSTTRRDMSTDLPGRRRLRRTATWPPRQVTAVASGPPASPVPAGMRPSRGRGAGTSFLVRFLEACGLDTGAPELPFDARARAGLERNLLDPPAAYVREGPVAVLVLRSDRSGRSRGRGSVGPGPRARCIGHEPDPAGAHHNGGELLVRSSAQRCARHGPGGSGVLARSGRSGTDPCRRVPPADPVGHDPPDPAVPAQIPPHRRRRRVPDRHPVAVAGRAL